MCLCITYYMKSPKPKVAVTDAAWPSVYASWNKRNFVHLSVLSPSKNWLLHNWLILFETLSHYSQHKTIRKHNTPLFDSRSNFFVRATKSLMDHPIRGTTIRVPYYNVFLLFVWRKPKGGNVQYGFAMRLAMRPSEKFVFVSWNTNGFGRNKARNAQMLSPLAARTDYAACAVAICGVCVCGKLTVHTL